MKTQRGKAQFNKYWITYRREDQAKMGPFDANVLGYIEYWVREACSPKKSKKSLVVLNEKPAIYASLSMIAEYLSFSRSTVIRSVERLVRKGIIEKGKYGKGRGGHCLKFTLSDARFDLNKPTLSAEIAKKIVQGCAK